MKLGCIFCGGGEKNSENVEVCSSCVARFARHDIEALKEAVKKHDLTKEQLNFLGISGFSGKKSFTPIKKK